MPTTHSKFPKDLWLTLLAGLIPLGLGLLVHRQGFNLLDDGLWLLGAKTIAQGDLLYRDLFSIYGPVRYLLLVPFFGVAGQSVLALALLKAVTDGVAAALGFRFSRWLGAGALAWVVPLGVLAVGPLQPRYVAAAGLAWLIAWSLGRRCDWRCGLGVGLAWGGLCLFGLDAAASGLVILVVGVLLGPGPRAVRRWLAWVVVGLVCVLGLTVATAAMLGVLGPAVWDTVVYPATRFSAAMGVSWFETFGNTASLGRPFDGLMTGEVVPAAWAGHESMRIIALRGQLICIWLVAPLGTWIWWRRRRRKIDGALGCAIGLAVAAWATLATRTDVTHLGAAWYGSLILLPVVACRLPGARSIKVALLTGFMAVMFLPQIGETLWLATHMNRPSLQSWDRPTAKVMLSTRRVNALESLFESLPWDGRSPVLIWPLQPGLHVLLDAPTATSQVTLLGGEVRDPKQIIAELETSCPDICLQGTSAGIFDDVRSIKQLAPELWTYLRRTYVVHDKITTPGTQYWTLVRVGPNDATLQSRPLTERLVDNEQRVANQTSVHLEPGRQVGQSFVVGDLDFTGIVVRWFSPAQKPLQFQVRIRLLGETTHGYTETLGRWQQNVTVSAESQRVELAVDPVVGSAGRRVAVTFEVVTDVPDGLFLGLHAPLPGQPYRDFYPQGDALVNGQIIDGDLYFLTY